MDASKQMNIMYGKAEPDMLDFPVTLLYIFSILLTEEKWVHKLFEDQAWKPDLQLFEKDPWPTCKHHKMRL